MYGLANSSLSFFILLVRRDVLLQIPGGDAGVPCNPRLDLPDGTKGDFGRLARILAFLGNGVL